MGLWGKCLALFEHHKMRLHMSPGTVRAEHPISHASVAFVSPVCTILPLELRSSSHLTQRSIYMHDVQTRAMLNCVRLSVDIHKCS